MLAGVLMDEIKILLRKLHSISAHKFTKVELGPLISGLTFNIVTRMIAGKRYYGEDVVGIEEARQFRELVGEMFADGRATYPGDFLSIFKFDTSKVDGYKLLTFGLGRRACPGMGLANRIIGLILGSLIQCFEWERVDGKAIGMVEGSADIAMPKLEPWKPNAKLVQS
ncbi:hypothetical protein QUC31_003186 [Theobroma cacao]